MGSPGVNLTSAAGRIIPPVSIGHRCAKNLSAQEGTGRKFKNVVVPNTFVARVPQSDSSRGVDRIPENFNDFSLSGNHCYRIALIGIHPDIFLAIESYAVAALENRMSDNDIAQAQRVSRKCGVASDRTFEVSLAIEFHLPERSPSGIDIEKIALVIES